jgi:predicted ATPase
MLKKFITQNYKNVVTSNSVVFNKLNIFIGPNNSGKSNFIEAMTYLVDLFGVGFEQSILHRNYRAILNRYLDNDKVFFEWTVNISAEYPDLTYAISINIPKQNYFHNTLIDVEKLDYGLPFDKQRYQRFCCHEKSKGECLFPSAENASNLTVNVSVKESLLNQFDVLLKDENFRLYVYPEFSETANTVKSYFSAWKYYRIANISVAAVQSPSRLRGFETFLNEQCDNFANVVRVIFPKYPHFKINYLEQLRKFMPIDSLEYEILGDREVNLFIMLNDRRFELSELSDGTAILMVLLFILCSPEKPQVLFIDEPELNLHPAWLRQLSHIIRDSSQETQIFLSTHSPELLDPMTELVMQQQANIYVFDREGHVQPLSLTEELEGFVAENWELGDLYRVGDPVIGGWPW